MLFIAARLTFFKFNLVRETVIKRHGRFGRLVPFLAVKEGEGDVAIDVMNIMLITGKNRSLLKGNDAEGGSIKINGDCTHKDKVKLSHSIAADFLIRHPLAKYAQRRRRRAVASSLT